MYGEEQVRMSMRYKVTRNFRMKLVHQYIWVKFCCTDLLEGPYSLFLFKHMTFTGLGRRHTKKF